MDSLNPHAQFRQPSFFKIYAEYCEIISHTQSEVSKARLVTLSKSLDSTFSTSDTIFNNLGKLMSHLDFSVDSHQFLCFYNFVFFVCREKGQKSIPVDRAIKAWKLVLPGRFRLLNQWCAFVEKNQRYNISEDTWQQLLAFSRCVYEDLDGYDPKGAWPVLIDDFVEHMYRTGRCRGCSSQDFSCDCGDTEIQSCISNTLRGLKLLPGSKRKSARTCEEKEEISFLDVPTSTSFSTYKRSSKNSCGGISSSPCAVEDSLSKGIDGKLSTSCALHYRKQRKV